MLYGPFKMEAHAVSGRTHEACASGLETFRITIGHGLSEHIYAALICLVVNAATITSMVWSCAKQSIVTVLPAIPSAVHMLREPELESRFQLLRADINTSSRPAKEATEPSLSAPMKFIPGWALPTDCPPCGP